MRRIFLSLALVLCLASVGTAATQPAPVVLYDPVTNLPYSAGGGGGGGGAVTIAAGADVTTGNTTDAAITTNTTGTLSGKLRGLIAILADIWNDSANSIRVIMTDSAGNEVVIPTAGLTSYTAAGATTNATNVKNAAGTIYGLSLSNTTTTVYYLRMYNLATTPSCASATGYVSTIPIPPASAAGGVGGREITKNIGQAFTTGIGFCVTGGPSSTDNTNAATGVFVEILYK